MDIRQAQPDDVEAAIALLPRLASFTPPGGRNPEDLWRGDAETLKAWARGERPDCFVHLAIGGDGAVVGMSLIRVGPEPMSGAPGAHLEAIALAEAAEGQGAGSALLRAGELEAARRGATCLTLHVFEANERALGFYDRHGYLAEYKRCIKYLAR